MYFKTGDFPVLQGLNRKEKNERVANAVKRYNKWISMRFYLVIATVFACAYFTPELEQHYFLPTWSEWAIFSLLALLFYAYLLWEINSAVFKAVCLYEKSSI
jgi:drug/metabolite transporter (DMT)-like permease